MPQIRITKGGTPHTVNNMFFEFSGNMKSH